MWSRRLRQGLDQNGGFVPEEESLCGIQTRRRIMIGGQTRIIAEDQVVIRPGGHFPQEQLQQQQNKSLH